MENSNTVWYGNLTEDEQNAIIHYVDSALVMSPWIDREGEFTIGDPPMRFRWSEMSASDPGGIMALTPPLAQVMICVSAPTCMAALTAMTTVSKSCPS